MIIPPDVLARPFPRRILFVCLGNICRSPLAEAVMAHVVSQRGLSESVGVASCGTGHWHVGGPADHRTIQVARDHGVPINHTARQLDPHADFARFDLLIAMDRSNRETIIRRGGPADRVLLMRRFDPEVPRELRADSEEHEILDVPDPYTGDAGDFREVFGILHRSCPVLLEATLATHTTGA